MFLINLQLNQTNVQLNRIIRNNHHVLARVQAQQNNRNKISSWVSNEPFMNKHSPLNTPGISCLAVVSDDQYRSRKGLIPKNYRPAQQMW